MNSSTSQGQGIAAAVSVRKSHPLLAYCGDQQGAIDALTWLLTNDNGGDPNDPTNQVPTGFLCVDAWFLPKSKKGDRNGMRGETQTAIAALPAGIAQTPDNITKMAELQGIVADRLRQLGHAAIAFQLVTKAKETNLLCNGQLVSSWAEVRRVFIDYLDIEVLKKLFVVLYSQWYADHRKQMNDIVLKCLNDLHLHIRKRECSTKENKGEEKTSFHHILQNKLRDCFRNNLFKKGRTNHGVKLTCTFKNGTKWVRGCNFSLENNVVGWNSVEHQQWLRVKGRGSELSLHKAANKVRVTKIRDQIGGNIKKRSESSHSSFAEVRLATTNQDDDDGDSHTTLGLDNKEKTSGTDSDTTTDGNWIQSFVGVQPNPAVIATGGKAMRTEEHKESMKEKEIAFAKANQDLQLQQSQAKIATLQRQLLEVKRDKAYSCKQREKLLAETTSQTFSRDKLTEVVKEAKKQHSKGGKAEKRKEVDTLRLSKGSKVPRKSSPLTKAPLLKLSLSVREDEQDHEPMEIIGYQITKCNVVNLEVSMESISSQWESYNKTVEISLMWKDCEDDGDENLVLVYAKSLNVEVEKRELFEKVAKLAKKEPSKLFPGYELCYCHEPVDDNCTLDHKLKFDATAYKEEHTSFYFAVGKKWANKACCSCTNSFGPDGKAPREMLPAHVCNHYFLNKGDCSNPFLCDKCYRKKLIEPCSSSGRTSSRRKKSA